MDVEFTALGDYSDVGIAVGCYVHQLAPATLSEGQPDTEASTRHSFAVLLGNIFYLKPDKVAVVRAIEYRV